MQNLLQRKHEEAGTMGAVTGTAALARLSLVQCPFSCPSPVTTATIIWGAQKGEKLQALRRSKWRLAREFDAGINRYGRVSRVSTVCRRIFFSFFLLLIPSVHIAGQSCTHNYSCSLVYHVCACWQLRIVLRKYICVGIWQTNFVHAGRCTWIHQGWF